MKVFICQPMSGRSDEEILYVRNHIREFLEQYDYTVIDSYIIDELKDPIQLLGDSISLMHDADFVYLAKGWETARRM